MLDKLSWEVTAARADAKHNCQPLAQLVTHRVWPLLQLHGRSVRRALAAVLQREGLRGLYGGVTAAAAGAG